MILWLLQCFFALKRLQHSLFCSAKPNQQHRQHTKLFKCGMKEPEREVRKRFSFEQDDRALLKKSSSIESSREFLPS